jgi:hypothetical protein
MIVENSYYKNVLIFYILFKQITMSKNNAN